MQAFLRLLAAFSPNDLEVARLMVECHFKAHKAACVLARERRFVKVQGAAFRQRLMSLSRKLQVSLPDLIQRRGRAPMEVSYDQYDMRGSLGLDESQGEGD